MTSPQDNGTRTMSEAKFTPGPWKVEPSIYEHIAAEVVAERGLANVWKGDRAMADARLIAAAPDLYAALKDTLNMLRAAHMQCGVHHDGNKRVVAARAALRKATGESA